MLIIVVLCLTVFGVLALINARADTKLSEKNVEYVTEYYAASKTANEIIAAVDGYLLESANELEFKEKISGMSGLELEDETLTFLVPINNSVAISVALKELEYGAAENRYRLAEYSLENTAEWNSDTAAINLW